MGVLRPFSISIFDKTHCKLTKTWETISWWYPTTIVMSRNLQPMFLRVQKCSGKYELGMLIPILAFKFKLYRSWSGSLSGPKCWEMEASCTSAQVKLPNPNDLSSSNLSSNQIWHHIKSKVCAGWLMNRHHRAYWLWRAYYSINKVHKYCTVQSNSLSLINRI